MNNNEPNIAFIFYEGPHDGAIISRLLRENGYKNKTDMAIKEFPNPIQGFLSGRIASYEYKNELKITQKPLLPNYILKSEDEDNKWFILYAMGGDSDPSKPLQIIKSLKYDFSMDPETSFETHSPYRIAFFFDIDKGLESRMKRFNEHYHETIPNFCNDWIKNYTHTADSPLAKLDGFLKIGIYNYGRLNQNNQMSPGTLEDILLPILQKKNPSIHHNAVAHVKNFQKNLPTNPKAEQLRKHNSDTGKAIIGTIGQPKHPGRANGPIISDTELITKTALNSDTVFSQILDFLQNLIN